MKLYKMFLMKQFLKKVLSLYFNLLLNELYVQTANAQVVANFLFYVELLTSLLIFPISNQRSISIPLKTLENIWFGVEMEHWMVWLGEKEVLRKKLKRNGNSYWHMFIKNSCSYISKKWKVLTYSFSKIIEKYIGNSSFLIKLHTYSLQLYLKLLKTSLHLYRFCQLLRNSYFSSFLANASPIKKPSSRLLPAKCVKNTSGRIIFFKLFLFRICFSLILL